MRVTLMLTALFALAPKAMSIYRQAFDHYAADLAPFGILDSKLRSDHFLAQVLHESGALRLAVENLNYSAKRIRQVWPSRFASIETARHFANDPAALANAVYGGRMGNVDPGDGWEFRGRGLLQLTGKDAYRAIGQRIYVDLLTDPDVVLLPEHVLRASGAVWTWKGCNVQADKDSLIGVTRSINGGVIGLPDREVWLQKVRTAHVVVTA